MTQATPCERGNPDNRNQNDRQPDATSPALRLKFPSYLSLRHPLRTPFVAQVAALEPADPIF